MKKKHPIQQRSSSSRVVANPPTRMPTHMLNRMIAICKAYAAKANWTTMVQRNGPPFYWLSMPLGHEPIYLPEPQLNAPQQLNLPEPRVVSDPNELPDPNF